MTPIIIPIFARCLVSIKPVACASAFGGVLIGNAIAIDEAIVTESIIIIAPPNGAKLTIEVPSAAIIGSNKFAVAVCDIKFAINKVNIVASKTMKYGENEPNGILSIKCLLKPLSSSPIPKAMPPATSHNTSQPINLKSSLFIIPVTEKTTTGIKATIYEFMP